MKRFGILGILVCLSIVLLLSDSPAQVGRDFTYKGGEGWGPGDRYGRMYDPKTVETLSGEVVSVTKMTPMKGMSYGLDLMLRTDKETVSVHLGPGWYLEKQDVRIEPKDRIEVKGSKITFDGKPAILPLKSRKGQTY